jgi:hypothetical protein
MLSVHACLSELDLDHEDGAVSTSEMIVDFYCTTWCHITEGNILSNILFSRFYLL